MFQIDIRLVLVLFVGLAFHLCNVIGDFLRVIFAVMENATIFF